MIVIVKDKTSSAVGGGHGDSRNTSASRESRDRRPEHGGRGAECERRLQEQEGGNETRGEPALEDLNMCKGGSKGEVHRDCGHR